MHHPLLVVTIDRLPAWILPCYGSTWVAMPGLDGLAARGVVCDRLVAPTDDPAANAAAVIAGAAAAAGPAALLVTDDISIARVAPGLETRFVEPRAATAAAAGEEHTDLARLCAALADAVHTGSRRLVWCHVASLGLTWDAPESFRAAYVDPVDPPPPVGAQVPDLAVTADTDPDLLVGIRQAFAGQLTLLAGQLARVLALADGWTVAVVGVRGLPLGLHGRVGPGRLAPYGELVHLPLILADGAGRMAAQRYGGLVIPADLGATLAARIGGDAAAVPGAGRPWQGRSLEPLFERFAPAARDRVVVSASAGAAVVTPGWHAVAEQGRPLRMFAKPDDFFELCDVADRCGAVAEELARPVAAAAAGDLCRAWTEPLAAAAIVPAR